MKTLSLLKQLVLAAVVAPALLAQQLSPAERAQIDSAAVAVLRATGAPSANIAIVRGGQIVYEHAYGDARIAPRTPASTSMRYAIGSVSKQFTAAAIMLLAQEGKLSLDDKVSKWHPALTRADDVSVRQLLSMTSGYQDYWPQDYVYTDMQQPTTSETILRRWAAGEALDFDPGTKWQYSNTNYVLAADIVERVSGMPLMAFLTRRIFIPLEMSVADYDAGALRASDAEALLRNALGPLRPAPKEGKGWLFGAGQLAMTARDLARWNISMMNRSLLRPESYKVMQLDVALEDGTRTGYGLGLSIGAPGGRRRVAHGGAVSGYTTTNWVYPEERAAITVFTNIYPGAAGANGQIANRIASILFAPPAATAADSAITAQARRIYEGLMKGTIDRARFTQNAIDYFTAQVLSDYASSLGPLGVPTEFTAQGSSIRGGMTIRSYRIRAGAAVMDLTTMTLPGGKIDQYIVSRAG
jgi:D-alanyl-D-alanine carboxypeptidase